MKLEQNFFYQGPNRRSDFPVIEREFTLNDRDVHMLEGEAAVLVSDLNALIGALSPQHRIAAPPPHAFQTAQQRFACLYGATAILLQRCAGHPVSETGLVPHLDPSVCRPYFEYEEQATGKAAAELSTGLLELLLEPDAPRQQRSSSLDKLESEFHDFLKWATPLAMPIDTRALLDAARRRNIPWFRVDRGPFEPISGDFRLRSNAMLGLGQGCHRRLVDGTFRVDVSEPSLSLARDRGQLFKHLASIGIPTPARDDEFTNCNMVTRAERSARRIGYPVSLKPLVRRTGTTVFNNLADAKALSVAAQEMFVRSRRIIVEKYIPGDTYRIAVANGNVLAVVPAAAATGKSAGRGPDLNSMHPSIHALVRRIGESLPVGLMEISIVTPDPSRPLEAVGGAVVDVELAPRLDKLLRDDAEVLRHAAEGFLNWLFPADAPTRVPVVAVTGTNGKTSTCRMIDRIMTLAGHTTGLACTDGVYIDGRKVADDDLAGLPGHVQVLNSRRVTAAVLESARGGAVQFGLGFDSCDVAACLNVAADHLGQFGIATVEEMAELKKTIVARARKAVVLNADDRFCLEMRDAFPGRRVCLISRVSSLGELRRHNETITAFGVVEQRDGENWIVLHDEDRSIPVVPVRAIPATYAGVARHYVSNALHAIAVCHLMDIPLETIRQAMQSFRTAFESTPGRLNIHHGRKFTVIMDFAHNPHGLRELCHLAGGFPQRGRKLLALACSAANSDQIIRDTAAQAAGHFDHYICKPFSLLYDRARHEVPALLREGLLSAGVDPSCITLVDDEMEAVETALEMGRDGDLLVIVAGKVNRDAIWEHIIHSPNN